MSQRVYIPGGSGYIGSIPCESFLSKGWTVHVVDNLMYKQTSLLHLFSHPNFNFEFGDFRDLELQKRALKSADVIIPLAALVGAPLCDKEPVLAKQVNEEAPLQLFRHLSKSQMVLMPTTNSAYGSGNANNYCDESSPLNPISSYAKAKVKVEESLMQLPQAISFRLATVFGLSPRMRLDLLVNDFSYRAKRDGKLVLFEGHFKRNYIHVRDVVGAFHHGIENFKKMNGQIYNVGLSTANISKYDLAKRVKQFVPDLIIEEDEFHKDPDQRNYVVSNEKIEKTGFETKYSLDYGIQEVLKAFSVLNSKTMRNHD